MTELQSRFKEAWSQALAGVNAAEQEAEKVLARIADAAGFTPEDVRRHARDFAERLRTQRRGLERAVDDAVRTVQAKVMLPTRGEVETLKQRVEQLNTRITALEGQREKPSA